MRLVKIERRDLSLILIEHLDFDLIVGLGLALLLSLIVHEIISLLVESHVQRRVSLLLVLLSLWLDIHMIQEILAGR